MMRFLLLIIIVFFSFCRSVKQIEKREIKTDSFFVDKTKANIKTNFVFDSSFIFVLTDTSERIELVPIVLRVANKDTLVYQVNTIKSNVFLTTATKTKVKKDSFFFIEKDVKLEVKKQEKKEIKIKKKPTITIVFWLVLVLIGSLILFKYCLKLI